MIVFAMAILYGLILAAVITTLVWLVRRGKGERGFPIPLLALLWPLASIAMFVWFYFEILETT